MGIAEILALAPVIVGLAERLRALIETAHANGEITKEQMDAALARKSDSESRWDKAIGDDDDN